MRPNADEGLLRDVLRFCRISKDAAGKPEHGRQMPARKQLECPFVTTGDPGHERLVAVIHRNEVAAIGNARSF